MKVRMQRSQRRKLMALIHDYAHAYAQVERYAGDEDEAGFPRHLRELESTRRRLNRYLDQLDGTAKPRRAT